MATPDASVTLSSATVYVLLADFTDESDRPTVYRVTNLNELVAIGDPANDSVEVLVDPIHKVGHQTAKGSVPGTGVDGIPVLPQQSIDFVATSSRIQRVWARAASATCAHGAIGS